MILRRQIERSLALTEYGVDGQLRLGFAEIDGGAQIWQYAILVTSVSCEIPTVGRLYLHSADCENSFGELKNQWGWGACSTMMAHDERYLHQSAAHW